MTGYKIFIVSRVSMLALRPLFLMFLLYFNYEQFSTIYALAITIIQGALFLLNSEAHRAFYLVYFDKHRNAFSTSKAFEKYTSYCLNHVYLAVFPVFLLCLLMTKDIIVSLLLCGCCVMEKVYDEIQRFDIYSRNYLQWSINCLIKFVIPLAISAVVVFVNENLAIYLFFGMYIFSISLIIYRHPSFTNRSLERIYGLKFYLKKHILKNRHLLIYSLLVSNVLYLDRMLVGFFFKDNIDTYILTCNMSVMLVIAYDYLYLTKRKPDLVLKAINPYKHVLNIQNFVSSFGFGVFSGIGLLVISEFLDLNSLGIDLTMTLYLLFAYTVYNFFSPIVQYSYWNYKPQSIISVETFNFIFYVCVLLTNLEYGVYWLPIALLSYITCRGVSYSLLVYAKEIKSEA